VEIGLSLTIKGNVGRKNMEQMRRRNWTLAPTHPSRIRNPGAKST